MRALHMLLSRPVLTAAAVAVLIGGAGVAHAAGPMIDWDPAYVWQTGGTLSKDLGEFVLRAEAVYTHGQNFSVADLNAAQRLTCWGSPSSHSGSPTSKPVFTTSARPLRRSASGSVSSSAGSSTTRAGQ